MLFVFLPQFLINFFFLYLKQTCINTNANVTPVRKSSTYYKSVCLWVSERDKERGVVSQATRTEPIPDVDIVKSGPFGVVNVLIPPFWSSYLQQRRRCARGR